MVDAAIPRTDDMVTAALNAMIAARPTSLRHLDDGRYGDVAQGWRAQEAVLVRRIADEVLSSRVPTSKGQALRELVSSENDLAVPTGPAAAIGTFSFTKSPGTFATGVVRKGTRIRRVANTSVFPQQRDAVYATIEDVYVPPGATSFTLAVQATQAGAASNVTPTDGSGTPTPARDQYSFMDPVFDTTLFRSTSNTITIDIGGGSDGLVDEDIQRIATSVGISKFGPLLGAAITGALTGLGVKRAAAYEDPTNGIATIFVADGSFDGSVLWANAIRQYIVDSERQGFGCRVNVKPATLSLVAIRATIVLRDGSFQAYTVDIANAVRDALADYFSNRPDWYTFKASQIRGVISGADPRIKTCSIASVLVPGTGTVIPDPAAFTSTPGTIPFWSIASNGLSPTFVNAS